MESFHSSSSLMSFTTSALNFLWFPICLPRCTSSLLTPHCYLTSCPVTSLLFYEPQFKEFSCYSQICLQAPPAAAAAAKSPQSRLTLCGRQPTRLLSPWDSPGKNTGVGCHFLLQCVKSESEVAQSPPTLRDPMDCSPPGSSFHGIFQARALEWGAIEQYCIQYIHLRKQTATKRQSQNLSLGQTQC